MRPLNFNFRTKAQRENALSAALLGFIAGLTAMDVRAMFPLLMLAAGIAIALVAIVASLTWIAQGDV